MSWGTELWVCCGRAGPCALRAGNTPPAGWTRPAHRRSPPGFVRGGERRAGASGASRPRLAPGAPSRPDSRTIGRSAGGGGGSSRGGGCRPTRGARRGAAVPGCRTDLPPPVGNLRSSLVMDRRVSRPVCAGGSAGGVGVVPGWGWWGGSRPADVASRLPPSLTRRAPRGSPTFCCKPHSPGRTSASFS